MSKGLQSTTRHFDTIVIGAGISGIACASRLLQHAKAKERSSPSILVLEARDRVGGRIGSVDVGGCRLDTGANWIHGIGTDDKPNPLMNILPHKQYKQLSGTVTFRPPSTNDDANVGSQRTDDWEHVGSNMTASHASQRATKSGDLVIPPHTAGTLMGTMWGLFDSLHETSTGTPASKAKGTSMLDAITSTKLFQDAFQEVGEEYHQALRALPQFIENMEAAPLVAQSAEGQDGIPGMGLLEFAIDDFDGDQVFLRDGYTAIVDELAKDLVKENMVEFGVQVEQIYWESNPITIKASSGSIYKASNVVCTLPLGVMKHHPDANETLPSLFQPALPQEKQQAITSLGFGTLDKIFMVYSSPWWNKKPFSSIFDKGLVQRPLSTAEPEDSSEPQKREEADVFMGFTDALSGLEIHQNGTTSSGLRILSVLNLESLTGFPALSCFISCSNAQSIEALPDSHAENLVHEALTSWLGIEPPKAKAVHVTRWSQDPFSRGSYSHMITGMSETKHREEFQKRIRNQDGAVLAFAGEHTSRNHFATAHGALMSGWREADAILGD